MPEDHPYIRKLAERLGASAKRLAQMAVPIGQARQVKEFSTDQRKAALARAMLQFIKAGESAAAAEVEARASAGWINEIAELAAQYEDAEKTIAQWQAEQVAFEAARSLLALERESLRQLEG